MAITFPVKIEFKNYPSGNWEDWSQYLVEPPTTNQRVESDNEGEAGAIVFDSASVTFRYESGNPVHAAFSADLTSVQRYLFRIYFPRTNKTPEQRFEGMADFSTIRWNTHSNQISFDVVDKLSALGILSTEQARVENTLNARALAQNAGTTYLRFSGWFQAPPQEVTQLWISIRGEDVYDFTSPILFPGELIPHPESMLPGFQGTVQYALVKESFLEVEPSTGDMWNKINITPLTMTQGPFNVQLSDNPKYLEKELYGVDINNISGGVVQSLKGIETIQALYAQAWPGTTVTKKPSSLTFLLPAEYAVRLTDENPLGGTPLDALITLTNSIKPSGGTLSGCYVYVDKTGNLVIQARDSVSTGGTARTLGATKVISKEKKYFWDKIVDGVVVTVKSWVRDSTGEFLEGTGTCTLQASGKTGFIKPKNEISKELIVDDSNLDTQEELNAFAAQEALNLLNFYGKRRAALDLVLNLDDNTIVWDIMDTLTIDSVQYFFTSLEIDGATRTVSIEAVETTGHNYDFRQIVVPLSESAAVGISSQSSSSQSGGIIISGDYSFNAPLLLTGDVVSLQITDNLILTSNALDTAQPIKTTDTPTFNQINLSSPGTTQQAVRADRAILTAAPLTGGGDLTLDRTISLDYNPSNLQLTTNQLNTIQDIHSSASPIFASLTLNSSLLDAYSSQPVINAKGAYIAIGDYGDSKSFPNGIGIKFHDLSQQHASIEFRSSESKLIFGLSSQSSHLRIDPTFELLTLDLYNKRLGINLTSPTEKFHLAGHFKQEGDYSVYNNFTSGWTGSGWRIDYNITSPSESTIEADNMFLRGTLSVYELLIQQIRATNGTVYVTACGKINQISGTAPNETVHIEDPSGHDIPPFDDNDILIVQRVNLDSTVVVKRIIRKVSTIDINNNVVLTSLAGAPADVGTLEKGDDLIRIGNTTNIARQGSIYLTSDDSNAPFIDIINNVTSWSDWKNPTKLKLRLGRLSGITDAHFGSFGANEYGMYAKGGIYLSSNSSTAGIAMRVDSATATLTMRQSSNVIFNFDTASATAKIAGWDFNNTRLSSGSSTTGFSLNTSATPFIAGTSAKGFEIYDSADPKLFIGKKDGNRFDWNVTTANELTMIGTILASKFSTKASISTTTLGVDIEGGSIELWRDNDGGNDYLNFLYGRGMEVRYFAGGNWDNYIIQLIYSGLDGILTLSNTLSVRGGSVSELKSLSGNLTVSSATNLYLSSTSGNVYLQGSGDIRLNPTGNKVLPENNYDINLGQIDKKYLTLHAAELWVETLVAQETAATIGGRIIVSPTTYLIQDLLSASIQIYVKHNNLASGDRIYLEAGGKVEFMAVTSGATVVSGGYRYNVTRNLDGSGANDWYAGDAVVNTGTTGDGFIDIYSINGVNAASQVGPTIVGNIRTGTTYNAWTSGWAVGHLQGLYGQSAGVFGAGFGKYANDSSFILIDNVNGIQMKHRTGGVDTTLASWDMTGDMRIGTSTGPNTFINTSVIEMRYGGISRIRLNSDGSGFVASSFFSWDTSGNITAGGWRIGNNSIFSFSSSASIVVGTATNKIVIASSNVDTETVIYAKNNVFGSSTNGFWLDASGRFGLGDKLTWTGGVLTINGSGTFSGTLTSTAGTIGGWALASDKIHSAQGAGPAYAALEMTNLRPRLKIGTASVTNGTPSGVGAYLGCDTAVTQSAFLVGDVSAGKYLAYINTSFNIIGGTITGGVIQTASSGKRIVLDGINNSLKIYDTSILVGEFAGIFDTGNSYLDLTGQFARFNFNTVFFNSAVSGTANELTFGYVYAINEFAISDCNLYRLSANSWKTDDNFIIGGGNLTIGAVIIQDGGTNILYTPDNLHIKQPGTTFGNGLRLIHTSQTNYWEMVQGGDNRLFFGYNGAIKAIIDTSGYIILSGGYKSVDGSIGASGSFTSNDGKTITVKDGIITSIAVN